MPWLMVHRPNSGLGSEIASFTTGGPVGQPCRIRRVKVTPTIAPKGPRAARFADIQRLTFRGSHLPQRNPLRATPVPPRAKAVLPLERTHFPVGRVGQPFIGT